MENRPRARSQHLTIWHALTKNIRKDPESPQLCSSCSIVTVQTPNCLHVLPSCSCSQAALLQSSAQCKEWKRSFCIAETYKNYCPVRGHLQDMPVLAAWESGKPTAVPHLSTSASSGDVQLGEPCQRWCLCAPLLSCSKKREVQDLPEERQYQYKTHSFADAVFVLESSALCHPTVWHWYQVWQLSL